jgi:DNA-binding MarR family transcriptional regulator
MGSPTDASAFTELDTLFHEFLWYTSRASDGGMIELINEYELTLPQIIAFDLMARAQQTITSLSAALQLTPGAVSRLVDRLVRKKYVTREEGVEDRRQKTLNLTPVGRFVFEQIDRARIGNFVATLSKLDPVLIHELKDVLERIVGSLRTEAGVPSPGTHPQRDLPPSTPGRRRRKMEVSR